MSMYRVCDSYTEYNATKILKPVEHMSLGIFLVVTGIFGGLANVCALATFIRFPKLLCTPSAIPEIAMIMADIAVACLHPFTGSAALVNKLDKPFCFILLECHERKKPNEKAKWLWGDLGCQMYGFFGFLFGIFQIVLVPLISFDRYVTASQSDWLRQFRKGGTYMKTVMYLFLVALFWAVGPWVGWGNYALTPTMVSCTIDYKRNDWIYATYLSIFMTTTLGGSLLVAGFFGYKTVSTLNKTRCSHIHIHWAATDNFAMVTWGTVLSTHLCFSAYGIAAPWSFFFDPRDMPTFIAMLPPAQAKLASCVNPIFNFWCNPQLWACFKKMIGCHYDRKQLIKDERDPCILIDTILKTPAATERFPENAPKHEVSFAEESAVE